MKPLVSVVMAVNKMNPYLGDAITSILNQTLTDFEFFIVANNCDEALMEFLQSFSDPRIRLHRTNVGQLAFNLNFAINLASADYIMRMDADDVSFPERMSRQHKFLQENPDVAVLGTSYQMIDSASKPFKEVVALQGHDQILSKIFYSNPICHPSTMYRRSSVLSVGGYLGGMMSEDYSLWLRLVRKGQSKFANLPDVLLGYRVHGDQARGHRTSYAEAAGLVFTEFLIRPTFSKLLGSIVSSLKIWRAK